MISYKELGLVNTKEMFAKAIEGGYAIPAFNFNNMVGQLIIRKTPILFPRNLIFFLVRYKN